MKKIKKASIVLFTLLLMLFTMGENVLAGDAAITFRGFSNGFDFQPGSEYTETDLFNNFKNVMPGDVLTEEITFTNSAEDCDFVRLYMRAEVHDEDNNLLSTAVAERESLATMVDFLSKLSMKVWNGEELLFSASPDELGGLKENQFLGTFRKGETAVLKVELSVPIELGNEFADRVGEVDWIFHVEADKESQISPEDPETPTEKLIQTGQLYWPIFVLGGCGMILLVLGAVMIFKKKDRSDAE